MQLKYAFRPALALVALATLAPLVHADEKADAVIKEAELRGKKLNSFSATLTQTSSGTPDKADKIELKIRRAPTRLKVVMDSPTGAKVSLYLNEKGGFADSEGKIVKIPDMTKDLATLWPGIFGSVSEYIGGTKSTRYVTQGTFGDDGHATDIIDVIGEKKTARLTINGEGIVEAIRTTLPNGKFEDMKLSDLVIDEPIADSVFALPEGAKVLDPKDLPKPGSGAEAPKGEDPMAAQLVPIGKAAPAFNLKTPTGGKLSLASAVAGHKATLVNFWATWCGPCMAEMPDLKKLYTRLSPKGFQLLSINDAEDAATIRKFIAREKLKFPVVMSTPTLLNAYGIEGIPTNYLLDSRGKIVFRSVGYDEAGLTKALAKLGLK